MALDFDPKYPEAHLVKGQLLIALRRDYPAAQAELERYLKVKPNDPGAAKLAELCRHVVNNDRTLIAFAEAFQEQQAFTLADGMMSQFGKNAPQYRTQLLALYQKRLEKAFPSGGSNIRWDMSHEGNISLQINSLEQLTDLSVLQGMALTELGLGRAGRCAT